MKWRLHLLIHWIVDALWNFIGNGIFIQCTLFDKYTNNKFEKNWYRENVLVLFCLLFSYLWILFANLFIQIYNSLPIFRESNNRFANSTNRIIQTKKYPTKAPTHTDRSLLSNYIFSFENCIIIVVCGLSTVDCRYQFACGQNKPFSRQLYDIINVNYVTKWFSYNWNDIFVSIFPLSNERWKFIWVRLNCFGKIVFEICITVLNIHQFWGI